VLLEADTIVQMRIRDMLACAFFLVSRMCEHDTCSESLQRVQYLSNCNPLSNSVSQDFSSMIGRQIHVDSDHHCRWFD